MLPYTDDEICALYRTAGNKKRQIGILAELNNTSKERIKEILLKYGYKVEFEQNIASGYMPKEIRKKRLEAYRHYAALGYTAKEAAKALGLSNHEWIRKHARKFGIEFAYEKEKAAR